MDDSQNVNCLEQGKGTDGLALVAHDERWLRTLELYVNFKEVYGHEPVQSSVYHDVQLGAWCGTQRQMFKDGTLSKPRLAKLTEVGFVFFPREERRRRLLELYVAYKKEFGREPATKTVYMGEPLGKWCSTQRCLFKEGALRIDQVQQLQAVGFVFDRQNAEWERKLALYVAYKNKFKEEPPVDYCMGGDDIGRWCTQQRDALKQGKLSDERYNKLLGVGFVFDAREFEWQRKLDLYIAYKQEFGVEPQQFLYYHDVYLGKWCDTQRTLFKTGRLAEDRVQKLIDAGFVFHYSDYKWQRKFELYLAYKQEFEREPAYDCAYGGVQLGCWCNAQRWSFREGKLPEERRKKLEDAGFLF